MKVPETLGTWQPIETAAKEPVEILGFSPGGVGVFVMVYFEGRWCEHANLLMPRCSPTHWMPLPEPPKKEVCNENT